MNSLLLPCSGSVGLNRDVLRVALSLRKAPSHPWFVLSLHVLWPDKKLKQSSAVPCCLQGCCVGSSCIARPIAAHPNHTEITAERFCPTSNGREWRLHRTSLSEPKAAGVVCSLPVFPAMALVLCSSATCPSIACMTLMMLPPFSCKFLHIASHRPFCERRPGPFFGS